MTRRTIAVGVMTLDVAGKKSDGTLEDLTEAAMGEFTRIVCFCSWPRP